ncbi:alpha/beta-Hydrolases superfamily protein [Striga hermonthica]|uniref:Alpha/beta-Hydrolases superfamily protein n=1 Tax=Striga hermonthica TaxID=68872 RepID=A0A9N7R9B2_STRHE|nr:alpha/beta-Hydrolases superfamily protein [Striga hermonthica]
MSLAPLHAGFLLPPSALHRRTIPTRHYHRARKRRRLKPLTVRNQLNFEPSPFGDLLHSMLSHFPSATSFNYIAPALGLASGLALLFSTGSHKSLPNPKISRNSDFDIGEWILFTSPTPFNRFVTLRCPSICFPGSEFLEDVNERLVKEDRYFVKLNSGRMVQQARADSEDGGNLVYQRICVGAEDGGVLSFDWPENLVFEEEHGLDTTMLIVPGTAEGSGEKKIRAFVCDCLRRGIFPVVMNPRGCAGSPLTTARLFTAADSDDISTAVRYIHKKRPWTTLMGVGWGYGANMLTKYLAESGEKTPLTAATCIDNPFDLEEAMKSTVYHTDFDLRHTNGLIEILHRNKEIFQGRGKGFDVEKALSASSTREFERAISMISYGFDTIEDFYEKSSTRDVVGRVKVPVLFIQNDDGRVPLFSIPRSAIAENPYTSLLLCAYPPSANVMVGISTLSWCQHLALEWLTAVELGLLKGRHPLLKDIDVTINPSKGLELVENRASNRTKVDKLLDLTNGNPKNPPLKMLQANDTPTTAQSRSMKDIEKPRFSAKGFSQEDNDIGRLPNAAVDVVVQEGASSSEDERGQVLQTAQVIMNMLDVTMPDTLTDEQKKKVLNAVDQGETLIKALQDAVPEDVRGKLTTAVSGILQNQGSNVKFDKLLSLGKIPDVASGLNSNFTGPKTNDRENVGTLDQKSAVDDPGDGLGQVDRGSEKPLDVEKQSSENLRRSNDTETHQPTSNLGLHGSDSGKLNINDAGGSSDDEQLSGGSATKISDRGDVPEINANEESSNIEEPGGGADKIIADHKKEESENCKNELDSVEENIKQKTDFSNDQSEMSESYVTEDKSSAPSPDAETEGVENKAESNQRKEDKGLTPVSSEGKGDSPRFSFSQALDALTGFDDSTQVAVNSVFHVIEGMIDQLEVEKDNVNDISEVNEVDKVKGLQHAPHEHNPNSTETENIRGQHEAENKISLAQAPGQLPPDNSLKCLYSSSKNIPSYTSSISSGDPIYREYLKKYLHLKMKNAQHSNSGEVSALYLDYIPEEGQWKLLEQTQQNSASVDKHATHAGGFREYLTRTRPRSKDSDGIAEPSYVILDSVSQDQNEELEETDAGNDSTEIDDAEYDESHLFIKNLILECLNIEVGRRASAADMEELEVKLAKEVEFVANAAKLASEEASLRIRKRNNNPSEMLGTLYGENIIKAISSALQETQYLRRVVPVGVVVGASLAALKKFFNVATSVSDANLVSLDRVDKLTKSLVGVEEKGTGEHLLSKREKSENISTSVDEGEDRTDLEASKNKHVMVGAVTAALGASALLADQANNGTGETSHEPLKEKGNSNRPSKLNEMHETTQNNIVTSLAEKAMSVASPVVPIKEDGEVDHERLVAMLTELGQKGGILKLVGKVALLWGGIRGAMSLTDKLISFLRIAERPLFQRIAGFVFLVLLLWSPVVLPFLPTLMQSWTTQKPFQIAEFACIAGLYVSAMIMVTLWGKRIRQYDDPLLQYGLDIASVHKFQNFLKGLIGGVTLVVSIHAMNSGIGCAYLSWPTSLTSSPSEPVALIKSYGQMLMLIVQGVATATGVSVVEELLFRSWLPQEIAADYGYHPGIIISGLVFALSQRSMWEIPGLWLLSLCLSGARQRSSGSLSLPIGLRTGILTSNFILKRGNFLSYQSNFPRWVTGSHPFQPFGGVLNRRSTHRPEWPIFSHFARSSQKPTIDPWAVRPVSWRSTLGPLDPRLYSLAQSSRGSSAVNPQSGRPSSRSAKTMLISVFKVRLAPVLWVFIRLAGSILISLSLCQNYFLHT